MIFEYFVRNRNLLILIFTLSYVAAFSVNAFFHRNLEFIYYTLLMVSLIYLALILHRSLHYDFTIMFGFSVLGFIHLAGGNVYLGEMRLYDFYFIPGVLRYDNVVHTFGTFIVTILLYNLLANYITVPLRKRYWVFALFLTLMALGVGTVNELVEFLAVVFLNAEEAVGGYFNNSLDIVFNTIGSLLATVLIYIYRERPQFLQNLHDKAISKS